MTVLLTILTLFLSVGGDLRLRAEQSWPDPRGITENLWQGSSLSFYQRLRFSFGNWSSVLFTEKDPGEEWGDLISGGVGYLNPGVLTSSAGALRIQVAHGLMLCHPGPWSGGNPLNLSKSPIWRMRFEPSESPGANDADPLTGAAAEYLRGNFSFSAVLGLSEIDKGSSGLHRTESELENQRSVQEKLALLRIGFGPAGLSFVHSLRSEDSLEESYSRIGGDFLFRSDGAVLTGEITVDPDSMCNFLISASRGFTDIRHALTVSRFSSSQPRTSSVFGSDHRIGAGYGLRWKLLQSVTLDTGALFLDKENEDTFRIGTQLTERVGNRTELAQRFKFSSTGDVHTFKVQATTTWSPYPDLTVSLKVPFTWYRCNSNPDENGSGLEIRLKHSPVAGIDVTLSAAASSTDGWNSRVYAYSLSFPGEFGSMSLYNSSVLLQGAVSIHISERTNLRLKGAWYNMEGEEFLGSGSSETEGSSRTSAGLQLDWKFQ